MPDPTTSRHTPPRADEILAVAIGGVVGALARAGLAAAVPHSEPGLWPWATFITNLLGCLLLGLLLAYADARHDLWLRTAPARARLARPAVATGILGGFTTFSTFSVEVVRMVRADAALLAFAYVVASVILGLALFALSRSAASMIFGRSDIDLTADEEL